LGFLRNFFGIILGIYGIWLIVSTFMAFMFNFRQETMDVYMFEVNIIGSFTNDIGLLSLGRIGIGVIFVVLAKILYESDK